MENILQIVFERVPQPSKFTRGGFKCIHHSRICRHRALPENTIAFGACICGEQSDDEVCKRKLSRLDILAQRSRNGVRCRIASFKICEHGSIEDHERAFLKDNRRNEAAYGYRIWCHENSSATEIIHGCSFYYSQEDLTG